MRSTVVAGARVCYTPMFNTRHIQWCPICKRRRRFVVSWPASPYYEPSSVCCGCGDRWNGGELQERPFARGWRKKSMVKARAAWAKAVPVDHPTYIEWRDAWLDELRTFMEGDDRE